jgi:ATP-binding cassette, subfamily B, bacterial MsbA
MSYKGNLTLRLARKYPLRILINIVLGFSGALFSGISTALIVPILLTLLGQEAVIKSGPPILRSLIQPFDSFPEDYRILAMALAVIVALILKNVTSYINSLATTSLSRTITAYLQESGLSLLLGVDLDFFTKVKAGDLMNRLSGEMSRTTTSISGVISLISTVITIFVFLGFLLLISWQLTLAATFLLPISALITQHLVSSSKHYGKVITNISQEYSGRLIEIFAGIKLVKTAVNESREYERFKELIRKREKAEFQSKQNSAAVSPIGEITNTVSLFVLVLLGRYLFTQQITSLAGTLLTYLVVLSRLLPYISQLNGIRGGLARSAASVEVVDDLLRMDNKPFMKNGDRQFTGLAKEIEIKHLSFAYPGSSEICLKDIHLKIPKGTTLALVGSSGAGKSTLADLLPRFYDPIDGQITLDGVDLREFDIASVRRAMGIVSQDTFLFNDTIRNNIAYGLPNTTDEEIIKAAKLANAYEFIEALPQGLNALIGDRGNMLSGGQRQRIAIARALLKNPPLLILDEATSALDTVSERLVQQALDELSKERTTIVIAHRLSTIQRAHQIAVLEKGQIVELGTHQELLKRDGQYSRLYSTQFSHTSQEAASVLQGRREGIHQASYEFRTRLNSMLGSLSLLADGLVDTPEEQNELAEQAYHAAIELFKTVRQIESDAQLSTSTISQN